MTHKFHHHHMSRLDSPERREMLPPEQVLALAGIGPGHTVIDIGAGTGYLSLPAAGLVGETGCVIAADTSPEMLEELAARARKSGVSNVRTVLSSEYGLETGAGTCDRALLCMVLHEVEDRPRFLREAVRVLKPGGRITVVEWQSRPTPMGPPAEVRIPIEEAARLLGQLELEEISAVPFGEYLYIASAARPRNGV